MRAYMTNEYKQNLIGNTFISSDSSEKYHVDSRDEKNSFGIIEPERMLLSELYECNLYYFLFGYSSDINHLPKYEAIPLVGECILVGKHGEVGMLTNPYREAQKKKEIEVDENDKLRLIALRQAAYDALKAAYPKKPDFAELDKDASSAECDDVLEQQGFAPGSREYEFHVKFKVKPEEHKTGHRIPYFEVEYYRCGNNKRPHFATSYKDWQNQHEMPHDSLAYQFYQKWNPFHLVEMTKEEYAEMRDDLEKLKKEYDYI